MLPITFTNDDFKAINPRQDDLMVITIEVENFTVIKTLVDQERSIDILYWKRFKKLQISEVEIHPYNDKIVGFLGEHVDTRRYINLYTKFREGELLSELSRFYIYW